MMVRTQFVLLGHIYDLGVDRKSAFTSEVGGVHVVKSSRCSESDPQKDIWLCLFRLVPEGRRLCFHHSDLCPRQVLSERM